MLAHASQLLRPRQAGTEVTPASTSLARRHLLAAHAPGHLDDLHVAALDPLTPSLSPVPLPSSSSLPLSSPRAAVAAACHSRARRAPLAAPTRPGEPQGGLHHL